MLATTIRAVGNQGKRLVKKHLPVQADNGIRDEGKTPIGNRALHVIEPLVYAGPMENATCRQGKKNQFCHDDDQFERGYKACPEESNSYKRHNNEGAQISPKGPQERKGIISAQQKEKGITATAGGTAAMRIKPVRRLLSVIKYWLSRIMTPLSTR